MIVPSYRVEESIKDLTKIADAYKLAKQSRIARWVDDAAGLLRVLSTDLLQKERDMAAIAKILAALEAQSLQEANTAAKAAADASTQISQLESQLATATTQNASLQSQVATLSANQLEPADLAELQKAAASLGLDPTTGDPLPQQGATNG